MNKVLVVQNLNIYLEEKVLIILNVQMQYVVKRKEERSNLFFSSPIRNPASASAAKKLPVPASFPVTAYSLTKAWNVLNENNQRTEN